jgi:hypothetical protein
MSSAKSFPFAREGMPSFTGASGSMFIVFPSTVTPRISRDGEIPVSALQVMIHR